MEKDLSQQSQQYSSRDLASHTKLKYRKEGQGTYKEYRSKDYRGELEERERLALRERTKERARRDGKSVPDSPPPVKKSRTEAVTMATLDADDPVDSSDSEDDDSDDDTAVLMAELNKNEAEKEAGKREEEEQIRMENIMTGNPLLKEKYSETGKTDMKIKKRWDDDVVFKNCSRAEPDNRESNFINDSLRNEFHKRFMDKYIK